MRLSNTGRGDLAAVRAGRDQSEAAALAAARAGNPQLAQELIDQQGEREVGAYNSTYLTANGHRRRRTAVDRDFRHRGQAQRRFERADARLRDNGGLIDVQRDSSGNVVRGRDPLTREFTTPEQVYDRKERPIRQASDEKADDRETLLSIDRVLHERLPTETV